VTTTTYAWAPITKSVKQDDGTLIVYGPATDAGLDRDEQRMNQEWLDQAMPLWKAEGGNIREQHDKHRAVGVAAGLTKDPQTGAHLLAAHVVDPIAVLKVEKKVLTGFSVGIKTPQVVMGKADAPNGEIVGGKIIEVSLVDRPSNPRTSFTMVKADSADELEPVDNPTIVEANDAGDTEDDTDGEPEPIEADGTKVDEPDLTKSVSADQRRKATQLIDQLTPDLAKYDETADIAGAEQAMALIARLIVSEATQLAAGRLDEARDISILLDAHRALEYFRRREQQQAAGPETADMMLADQTTPDEGVSTTSIDTPELIKAAVAEAIKPVEERAEELATQLATLKTEMAAMPQPGGPVLTRVRPTDVKANTTHQLREQASELLAKADQFGTVDLTLAAGYRDRAQALLAQADAA